MSPAPPFEVLSVLGRGAESRVERVLLTDTFADLPAGTEVAVKRLVDPADRTARRALEHEFRTGRRLDHPALVRMHVFGEDEGGPFLVLDLLPGPSLAALLATEGALGEPRVRTLGARLADALGVLHEAGLVHNDLKPENVLLDERGRVVLVDLGLAARDGQRLESTPGSLAYFAPERLRSNVADRASDVFALGVLLYEVATAQHPFVPPGAEPAASIAAIEHARCDLPSRRTPRLSPLFDELMAELLAIRPDRRPRAREVAQRLRAGEGSAWWRRRRRESTGARWGIGERLPLVGRDAELTSLAKLWDRVRASDAKAPRSAVALVTGSAGTGKLRLAGEFAVRARRDANPPAYLFARWTPSINSRPAGALSMWFDRWAERRPDGSVHPELRERLEDWLHPRAVRGLLEETAEGDWGVANAVEWLVALGRHEPTILFLDDLHRAESHTLGALIQLFARLDETRLFLTMSARLDVPAAEPELFGRLVELVGGVGEADPVPRELAAERLRLDLAPLDADSIRAWVDDLFHRSAPRMRLAEVLADRCQGNPGLFGELVAGLVRRGEAVPVSDEDPTLVLRVAPDRIPHPPSLERLLAERLQALAPAERRWLERASIVGGRITARFLSRTFGPVEKGELDRVLASLVTREWLVPAGKRYRFTRPALREAVYLSLPPGRRRLLHLAAAAGLREEGEELDLRYQRAFHLHAAGSWPELAEASRELSIELRERSSSRRSLTVARWGLEALERAPEGDDVDDRRLELLEFAADASDRLGLREEQRELLDDLAAIEERQGRTDLAARVYLLHARYNVATGQFGVARGMLRNAVLLADEAGDAHLVSEANRRLAEVHAHHGDADAARACLERARASATTDHQRSLALTVTSHVDVLEDRLEDALEHAQRALAIERESARSRGAVRARAWMLLGRTWRSLGDPYHALMAANRAWRIAHAAGERGLEVEARARLGGLLLELDHADEAEAQLRDALLLAEEISDRPGRTLVLVWLGLLLWEADDDEEAAQTVLRGLELARELTHWRAEAVALAILARVALLGPTEDLERAQETSERALGLVDKHGAEISDALTVAGTRVLVLERAGRSREAAALAARTQERVRRSVAGIRSLALRRSHGEHLRRLFASVRSGEGHVWPRRT